MTDDKKLDKQFIPNFTQYPNEILDHWMPHLSGNQTKIMNVFVRQIYGYHKEYDKISIRQISNKTGITTSKVFKDIKILIGIGCIKILKKGDKNNAHTYQILNITDALPQRIHKSKIKGVTPEVTGCYTGGNSSVTPEVTVELPQREQQNIEINIKEMCEIKRPIVNNHEEEKTTELPIAHTPTHTIPEELRLEMEKDYLENERLLAEMRERDKQIAINSQNRTLPSGMDMPKFTLESLLEASESFLGRVGIGFDSNPRRIMSLIYKQLPQDFVIKEDGKDVEILGDMLKKYSAGKQDERESIAKRIYQAVESMLKIYVIKKYGDPYREVLYPKILGDNLILYLNCNPTFKYCLGGFSNDIDGVYNEIVRLTKKKLQRQQEAAEFEEKRRLERERVREHEMNRPHYTEDEVRAMGLRPVSDIIKAMDARNQDIEHLDEKYQPILELSEEDKQKEVELLRIMVAGQKLTADQQIIFDRLKKKKANG